MWPEVADDDEKGAQVCDEEECHEQLDQSLANRAVQVQSHVFVRTTAAEVGRLDEQIACDTCDHRIKANEQNSQRDAALKIDYAGRNFSQNIVH